MGKILENQTLEEKPGELCKSFVNRTGNWPHINPSLQVSTKGKLTKHECFWKVPYLPPGADHSWRCERSAPNIARFCPCQPSTHLKTTTTTTPSKGAANARRRRRGGRRRRRRRRKSKDDGKDDKKDGKKD